MEKRLRKQSSATGDIMSEAGKILRVDYYQGDNPRFIKGKLKSETEDYVELELHKYVVKIFKKHIIKIESEKNHGRDAFEY